MALYVNSPVGRGNRDESTVVHSGESKVFKLLGLGFGLLCLTQLIVNIALWRHAGGLSSRSDGSACNFTLTSSDDIRALTLERDQLLREKHRVTRERDRLAEENRALNVKPGAAVATEANVARCPPGWQVYMSSCYQLSSVPNTWDYAKQDCQTKGAHLIILNAPEEKKVVLNVTANSNTWVGLENPRIWKWVDGSHMTSGDVLPANSNSYDCAYLDVYQLKLFPTGCKYFNLWMCEMEL